MNKICRALFMGIGILCVCACSLYAQVEVVTDKTEYALKEAITISVMNTYPYTVFSIANTLTPSFSIANFERRRNQWGWDAYAIRCHRLNCDQGKSEEPQEIKSGQKITFIWLPEIYEKNSKRIPKPGVYRLTIMYQMRKRQGEDSWIWETVKSNEFTLR